MKSSQGDPERRGKYRGGRFDAETGRGFLIRNLVELQGRVLRTETQLSKGKSGVRLRELKRLVKLYNESLIIIFGKDGAKRLLNYKVVGKSVETYIPEPESIDNRQKKGKKKKRRRSRRESEDHSIEDSFFDVDFGYDSDEVAYAIFAEEDLLFDEAELSLSKRDDIQPGTGYVVVHDNQKGMLYPIPFTFAMDLSFIKMTLDLYLANGYPVTIVVHPSDINNPLVSPKPSARWN